MDGFDEKLGKLLADPEAVSKMMELAKSFTGGAGDAGSAGGAGEAERPSDDALPPTLTAASPLAPDLAGLLGKLDPGMLSGLVRLAGEWGGGDDRRATFIQALRPYVRSERRGKLDRAVEILRLAKLAKNGLGLLGGGDSHV